jgi:hypothetical protein
VAGGCDEVKERMNAIIAEARVTLDSRFSGKNVIVLSFEVAHDFAKGRLVVDLVTKTGGINDRQRHTSAFLVKLKFFAVSVHCSNRKRRTYSLTNCDGFDSDAFFQVGVSSVVGLFRLQDLLAAECIDESCAS